MLQISLLVAIRYNFFMQGILEPPIALLSFKFHSCFLSYIYIYIVCIKHFFSNYYYSCPENHQQLLKELLSKLWSVKQLFFRSDKNYSINSPFLLRQSSYRFVWQLDCRTNYFTEHLLAVLEIFI